MLYTKLNFEYYAPKIAQKARWPPKSTYIICHTIFYKTEHLEKAFLDILESEMPDRRLQKCINMFLMENNIVVFSKVAAILEIITVLLFVFCRVV